MKNGQCELHSNTVDSTLNAAWYVIDDVVSDDEYMHNQYM